MFRIELVTAKAPGIPVLFTWASRGELSLPAYTYDRESANSSRYALEQLIEMLAANPNVKEVNIVAHSMGNLVALEALRGMVSRRGKIGAKVRNVMLVSPNVGVDVFVGKFKEWESLSRAFFCLHLKTISL